MRKLTIYLTFLFFVSLAFHCGSEKKDKPWWALLLLTGDQTDKTDKTVPTVGGNSITVSNLKQASVTLTWNAASDNSTSASDLEYLVYYSNDSDFESIEKVEKGTAVGSFQKNITTKDVTDLRSNTVYYFNVVVKDSSGNKSVYKKLEQKTPVYRIFISNATYTSGNLAGLSGADSKCNSDTNKPSSSIGTYKAMLVDGTNRIACSTANCSGGKSENKDWVFKANTSYFRADGTTRIGTTNASGVFTLPLENGFGTSTDSPGAHTGLLTNWTLATHCGNWSSDLGTTGCSRYGNSNSTSVNFDDNSLSACAAQRHIICVEQ